MFPIRAQIRVMSLAWIAFLTAFFAGAFSLAVFRSLFALCVLTALLRPGLFEAWIDSVHARFKAWHAALLIAACFAWGSAALLMDYEGFSGTLWDLSQFMQVTHRFVNLGSSTYAFIGREVDYSHVHRSVVDFFLVTWLYRWIGSPWVVVLWQGFGLLAPGLVLVFGYREVMRRNSRPISALGMALAFFSYFSLPTVQAQTLWPSTFHALGWSFLAMAYFFYYRQNWLYWLLFLVLAFFEKEEWGLIGAAFGCVVLVESIRKKRWLALACSLTILILGVGSYLDFAARHAEVIQFKDRFSHWGSSPSEALMLGLLHPLRASRQAASDLLRHDSFVYLRFIALGSLLWYSPRWRAIRFFLPVLPLVLLYALANEGPMQQLKDHYSLPVSVALSAVYVYGILDRIAARDISPARIHSLFFLIAFFPMCWNHQSAPQAYRSAFASWRSTVRERALLAGLRKNRETVVCCEERLCSVVSDRNDFFIARVCEEGSPLLEPLRGRPFVYLMYRDSPQPPASARVKPPLKWEETPFLRLSSMTGLQ